MDYTLDTLGVETCAGTVDDWDVCTNRTTMTFNYTTCVSEMVYSSNVIRFVARQFRRKKPDFL
jgi:hypothetical protein